MLMSLAFCMTILSSDATYMLSVPLRCTTRREETAATGVLYNHTRQCALFDAMPCLSYAGPYITIVISGIACSWSQWRVPWMKYG